MFLANIPFVPGAIIALTLLYFLLHLIWNLVQNLMSRVHKLIVLDKDECIGEPGHHMTSHGPPAIDCRKLKSVEGKLEQIVEQIDKARYSIDVALYSFGSLQLSKALKQALRRNVKLRLISRDDKQQAGLLAKLGVPLRCATSRSEMRHNFLVIDGYARRAELGFRTLLPDGAVAVLIYCLNWKRCLISSKKSPVKDFETEFMRMWHAFQVYPQLKTKSNSLRF